MENTKIQWCDHTFNHMRGCTKVSPGCANCYAETLSKRNPKVLGEWGPGKPRVRASAKAWRDVEKWNRQAVTGRWQMAESGDRVEHVTPHRPRVFCASMADWLDDADVRMPDGRIDKGGIETLADLLDLIRKTPNLDWLLLTKRPENFDKRLLAAQLWLIDHCKRAAPFERRHDMAATAAWLSYWRPGEQVPYNVWLGTSAEDQQRWDERVPILLSIPAKVRFVSVEPMLEPIDMTGHLWESGCKPHCGERCSKDIDCPIEKTDRLHAIIFGGESGAKARPCNVDWIRAGVRQCREAGVAAFVKQLGGNAVYTAANLSINPRAVDDPAFWVAERTADRKGGDWSEWPEDLRVREWPEGRAK